MGKLEDRQKKQEYYAGIKEANKGKWDNDFVDYDQIDSKTDDEEYWMRGRNKKEPFRNKDRREKRLTHKEEVKAEEKGAIFALATLAALIVLFGVCRCCYQKIKGNANTSSGYNGVELRI